jgi:hypothetical protein
MRLLILGEKSDREDVEKQVRRGVERMVNAGAWTLHAERAVVDPRTVRLAPILRLARTMLRVAVRIMSVGWVDQEGKETVCVWDSWEETRLLNFAPQILVAHKSGSLSCIKGLFASAEKHIDFTTLEIGTVNR